METLLYLITQCFEFWPHVKGTEIPRFNSPVKSVKSLLTALHITLKWLLLGVHTHMDLQAVRGEEGFPTTLLVAHKSILSSVGLLVGPQVSRCTVRSRTASEHALVTFNLRTEGIIKISL